jgi:hypothetical protein
MRIEILEKDFPYEEITELLHESYKGHLEAGRNYLAAVQSVEQTKERLQGAYCVVAYDEDRLVGTMAFRICRKEPGARRKWYEDDVYVYGGQLAVLPSYRDTKVFALMALKASRLKEIREAKSSIADTSVEAHELVASYLKMGYQIVDLVSWETTNYYSYVFRKKMTGRAYSDAYCRFRFEISKLLCKLQYKKNGERRFGK